MKSQKILFIILTTIALISCKDNKIIERAMDDDSKVNEDTDAISDKYQEEKTDQKLAIKHWSYNGETGPQHWAKFEKEGICDGKAQSPINIIAIDSKADNTKNNLVFHYSKDTKIHDVKNNGHSIQFNFETGDNVVFNGETYHLKQFHFHEASEHTINGVRFPIETHLVHQNDKGALLVIGILSEEGKNSPPFTTLESYLPLEKGMEKAMDISFDINSILPKDKAYYSYTGSLTTPPCSESVQWFVFKKPTTISEIQVKELQQLMPLNNYRNEQLLNGRVVYYNK